MSDEPQTSQQGDDSSNGAAGGNSSGDQAENPLQLELQQAQQKIADLTEMSKRALADLSNYRKRVEDERVQFTKFANVGFILQILPVIDNLKRAMTHTPEDLKNNDWVKGVLSIEKQLLDVIKKEGIVESQSAVGQKFDPYKHEVVTQGPGEKDVILEEFEPGYLLGEKLIRPARVKVGDGEKG